MKYKKLILEQIADIPHLFDEEMKNHTTFRVGGACDVMVVPQNEEQMIKALRFVKSNNLPLTIVGNGSNLLVGDRGIRGVVIKLDGIQKLYKEGDTLIIGSGVKMSRAANFAMDHYLSGMEFAHGIPGTVGGGVYMNAGAYDGEMKDIVVSTNYVDFDGNLFVLNGDEHCFRYRHSIFMEKEGVITQTKVKLHNNSSIEEIKAKMSDFAFRRKDKQPIELPSAGSTFKRPVGFFAGKLIEDAGLRGKCIGGAMVSTKHCGFIVNFNNATAKDIIDLINFVKDEVKTKFDVTLECEVKMVGEF